MEKYVLIPRDGEQWSLTHPIPVPISSKVCAVDVQSGKISVWIEVPDREAEKEDRHFEVYRTGKDFIEPSNELCWIGSITAQSNVLHVYERIKK